MKAIAKLGALILCVLIGFAACDLFTGISVTYTATLSSSTASSATVYYTATNVGAYDLTGVNLEIAALSSTGTICGSTYTPSFSLAQNSTYSSYITFGTFTTPVDAKVVGVDMDKP